MGAILRLAEVSVAFTGAEGIHPVLQELDLEIARGEWVSLVGRNGSGKSTLGRVLAGLLPVSRGTVERADGRVQLVFQNPDAQIVGETVWEDVCFGLENLAVPPEEMPKRVESALGLVGLLPKKDAEVTTLSGGQKQLLAVAGCLAMEAETLVFDEATSMLDPESRARLLQVAEALHRAGRTVLWITQWMDEVAHAERVVALEAGRVVFDGTPEAFFYDGGVEGASDSVGASRAEDSVLEKRTPCEVLGFAPPYVVQVARALERRGVALRTRPLLPAQLGAVVR
ncbi:ATP-binding cassette domain-containing protein [Tumebacillus permanentifrigoris]|uniref:Energy-coupling factor transport system ATP-binding protein n=1 Tax=Tumebacillus permanentifrigoris TaxID=378543 RepID=A0A316D8A5_9BACL|nr:ATP-binding cassette domain-containing protein [Tumebacillus permanentifrigoris]PWK13073.1 energy-coupling factor transport system ATP-binding protein [Tumebacillus permanentifrigoris]